MCVTICGRFRPDEVAVAGYGNRIWVKYTTICTPVTSANSMTENSDSVSIQLICIFLEFLSALLL
ncbi:MAG: DUF6783 domain-containing protein [Blautia faecis]|uniref:DUF6783 domain-containing protein n=1 Tax=Clostridia TaxID=186801 RepID=UPI002EBCBAA1|nr:DUF6783 domain-containing protein [Blautia faecis]